MSRTHVHAPFWVIRNRAAEADPFNNIDHNHAQRGIYQHDTIEEVVEEWETRFYEDGYAIPGSYRKRIQRIKEYRQRRLVGMTEGVCDYAPLEGHYPQRRTYTECEPSWHVGSKKHGRYSYYWHAGWGKSYRDEKDAYWGGARSEQRQQQQRWAKEYNSGESLEDADDYLGYEEDHSFPFWW